MARWADIERAEPEFAAVARGFLDAHTHKTIATLRRDGAPRISGTEAWFADGDLWFGSMWQARKALDLLRDPRFALHSASEDPPGWKGDAKVSGRVEEVTDPERMARATASLEQQPGGEWHLFRAEIAEVATVRLPDPPEHLIIESWAEGRGLRRTDRK